MSIRNALCAPCDKNPQKAIAYAWFTSIVFVVIAFICACATTGQNTGEGSASLGFAAIWTVREKEKKNWFLFLTALSNHINRQASWSIRGRFRRHLDVTAERGCAGGIIRVTRTTSVVVGSYKGEALRLPTG